MKNFELVAENLDVSPLLKRIEDLPELWDEITIRQDYPGSSHHSTKTIYLRGPRTFTEADYFDDLGAYDYPALDKILDVLFPVIHPVFEELAVKELGRMLIVSLAPNSSVDTHIDEGRYADHYSRFHIPLQTKQECILGTAHETCHLPAGQAWWFNHKTMHYAKNPTNIPRIHLIFDAVSPYFYPGGKNDFTRLGATLQTT